MSESNGIQSSLSEEAEGVLSRARALSQRVAQCLRREEAERDQLGTQVKQLQLSIKEATVEARAQGDEAALQSLEQAAGVMSGQGPGGDLKRLLGTRNLKLLQLLLGTRTCVVAWSTSRSLAIKEEYHQFRMRCTYVMALFSTLLLLGFRAAQEISAESPDALTLAPPLLVGFQLYLAWLLFFYVSMSLRENVLMVNGSHIRPWWIQHHYWSVFTCLLLLTLPVDSPVVSKYVQRCLGWTALQSLVMMLQNRYQRRRMYTRIALGKNNAMDVLGGESSGGFGQLLLLYPLLFALQGMQIWIGVHMMVVTWEKSFTSEGWLNLEPHESDLWGNRGVFLVGLTMAFMGAQNFRHTSATIAEKRTIKKKLGGKAASGKQREGPGSPAAAGAAAGAPADSSKKGQ